MNKTESMQGFSKIHSKKNVLDWTQDAYLIEGNNKKSALFYSWVCGETNNNDFSIDAIDHINLGNSTIGIN